MMTDTPLQCLTYNLQRAARSLAREMEAALRPVDLSAPQFATLSLLDGYGNLTISRLAEALGSDRTTITRNLTVLRRRGLITEARTDDGRAHMLALTEAGRSKLTEAMPLWRAQQERSVRRIGPNGAAALLGQLKELTD